MSKFYKINESDNTAVALEDIEKGYCECGLTALQDIPFGHKILLADLKKGDNVIKYGYPIGHIISDTPAGSYVHEHNIKTNLNEKLSYTFSGDNEYRITETDLTFDGYVRQNGDVATRNEIWIIPTVGCVNKTVQKLENLSQGLCSNIDGIFAFTHPYGCSQMGDDQEYTRKALAGLVNHPNAGGVLVVSLGCENTNIDVLKSYIGDIDANRVKFLVTQNSDDEIEEGLELIKELCSYAKQFKRQPVPVSKLKIGLKCGGSDAFSGITANALCGKITDKITSVGGACILTEVPEMFGAEQVLMSRAQNENVFNKIASMINSYKSYFEEHNQVCYENPSPGNHQGGITTLEEKSLGCVQKGGGAVVTDVLDYYEKCKYSGLSLLKGPGNDIVSTTNLTCAGAVMILFTTGRGTPLGAPVPIVKISSNSRLADKKSNWIDFNAEKKGADELLSEIISIASGIKTKNEINGCREIAIFKDGVVL